MPTRCISHSRENNTLITSYFLRLFFFSIALSFCTLSYADIFEQGLDAFGGEKYDKAYDIFKPLAENGNAAAQYYIGVMYANGQGVKRDIILAYAWYSIAAEEQDMAEENRNDIEKKLSLAQLKRAKRLAREFNRKYTPH